MKALSIRQPWAWLIANGYKDVENRDWSTRFRGFFLIHAAQKFDKDGYLWVLANTEIGLDLPPMHDFLTEPGYRGGIVGSALLPACNDTGKPNLLAPVSPWFIGKYGFHLMHAETRTFRPLAGKLGFFDVEDA